MGSIVCCLKQLDESEFCQARKIGSFLHVTLPISIDELMVGFDEWYMFHLWFPLLVAIDLIEYDDCRVRAIGPNQIRHIFGRTRAKRRHRGAGSTLQFSEEVTCVKTLLDRCRMS